MDVLEAIYTRRSVRSFTDEPVSREQVIEILKAGSWAPSGLNNQPWRFVVVRDDKLRSALAELTRYGHIIRKASVCIAVFCDHNSMYHDMKDHQSIGGCLQNMLLAAHGMGVGAVWLGEIVNRGEEVRMLFELPEEMELMAVVAVGHPASQTVTSTRKDLSELLVKEL